MPITIGPFVVKSWSTYQLIEDILAWFGFEDVICQYDPIKIFQEKRKRLKRGTYEHRGTSKMEKLENKFAYLDEEKDSEEAEEWKLQLWPK